MRSSEWLHALPPSPTVSGPSGGSAPDPWTILVYLVGCGVVCCHFGCFLFLFCFVNLFLYSWEGQGEEPGAISSILTAALAESSPDL